MSNSMNNEKTDQKWYEWEFNYIDYSVTALLSYLAVNIIFPKLVSATFGDALQLFRTDLGIAFLPILDLFLALVLVICIINILLIYSIFYIIATNLIGVITNQMNLLDAMLRSIDGIFWLLFILFLLMLSNTMQIWIRDELIREDTKQDSAENN